MAEYLSSFTTNCTLPQQPTHYVSSPNVRGTLTILWSALSALLLCTWSIQHLNVPAQWTPTSWRSKILKLIWPPLQKIFWMLVALVAPELFIGAALTDLVSAYTSVGDMKFLKNDREDDFEWGLSHGFYANMGGFVIDFNHLKCEEQTEERLVPLSSRVDERREDTSDGRGNEESERPIETGTIQTSDELTAGRDSRIAIAPNARAVIAPSLSSQPPPIQLDTTESTADERSSTSIAQAVRSLTPFMLWSGAIFIYPENNWESWKEAAEKEGIFSPPNLDEDLSQHKRKPRYGPFIHPAMLLPHNDHYPATKDGNQHCRNEAIVAEALHLTAVDLLLRNIEHSYRLNLFFMNSLYIGRFRGSKWALDARQLFLAHHYNIIDHIPSLTEEEIDDQSKSDILVKGLAITQILYLVVQLIVRARNQQPSSQLEVAVVAFAASAVITYALLFQKTKDVKTPRYIKARAYPTPYQLLSIALSIEAPAPPVIIPNMVSGSIPNFSRHWCSWNNRLYKASQAYFGSRFSLRDLIFLFGTVMGSIVFWLTALHSMEFRLPLDGGKDSLADSSTDHYLCTIGNTWAYLFRGSDYTHKV